MKKLLLALFIGLNFIVLNSQITFNKTYPGTNAFAILQTKGQGYIYSGNDYLTGLVIGKLSPFGKPLWSKNFGGNYLGNGNALITTSDNNYLTVGDIIQMDTNYNYYYYSAIIKFDTNGTVLFEKLFGNPGIAKATTSVYQTSDNGYLVMSNSMPNVVDNYLYLEFTKFNSSGDSLWNKKFQGNYQTFNILKATDNSLIFTGSSNDSLFLMKVDESADSLWSMKYFQDEGLSLALAQDSGFMMGTYFGYIVRTNKKGDTLWTQNFFPTGWSFFTPNKICSTTDGNFVTTGPFGYGGATETMLLKYNLKGDTLWTRLLYNPVNYTQSNSVQQTTDNGFIVCGQGYDTNLLATNDTNNINIIKTDLNGLVYSLDTPKICIITLDSASQKNLIVWEKQQTPGVASFSVYRGGENVGTVPNADLSVFIDSSSSPQTDHYRYTLSANGINEDTLMGPYQETMLLQVSQSVISKNYSQLSWNPYKIENSNFYPANYNIYKGKSQSTMKLLKYISGQTDSPSTDDSTYDGTSTFYQIGFNINPLCYPTGIVKSESGPYAQSLSNITEYQVAAIRTQDLLPATVYPNPFSNFFTITFYLEKNSDVVINITNNLGTIEYEQEFKNMSTGEQKLNLTAAGCHLTAGMHYIKIIANDKYNVLKCTYQ